MNQHQMSIFRGVIFSTVLCNNLSLFFYVFFQRYTDEILTNEDPSQPLIPPLQHYLEKPINRIQQYQTIIKVKSFCYTFTSDKLMFCAVQLV